jgi:CubicO group peptidase (beta-lactamase class C family)
MSADEIWAELDERVAAGRFPGYAAAIRIGEHTHVRVGGRRAIEPDAPPMTDDTLFRIASLTKPMGAALTLSLVQDGVLSLDDPASRWLPELESPRVLAAPDAPLDDTVPAERPITVRHLLTFTAGWGAVLQPSPLQAAMFERGVFPGPTIPEMSGDEFVARVAELPLVFQPGDGWLYDTPMDVLGVLLARAAGKPLSALFSERVTGPLGMRETSFWTTHTDRLTTAYRPGPDGLEVRDPPDGAFAKPPPMEELGSGLVSTAGDVLMFFSAMAVGGAPVLTAESVDAMTSDALTERQRDAGHPIIPDGASWGYGCAVDLEAREPWMSPGRWGWNGGTGTTAYADPVRNTVCVLLTQREMAGAEDGPEFFWTGVARAAE